MRRTLKHILHTHTHTYVQLDTPHTCWVFRGSWAPFCLYLKMKGGEEECGDRQEGEEEGLEERRKRRRGRGQRKRADKEEEEEQGWRVIANSARSHLSSLLLSFVNRWVEVSDCDESQNGKKRGPTDTYIQCIHTGSHTWQHTHFHTTRQMQCFAFLVAPHSPLLSDLHTTQSHSVCV